MGRRGTFKYICEECNAVNWLSARARSSHNRPRCVECGSTWLEPSSGSHGPEKLSDISVAVKENNRMIDKKMGKNKGFLTQLP